MKSKKQRRIDRANEMVHVLAYINGEVPADIFSGIVANLFQIDKVLDKSEDELEQIMFRRDEWVRATGKHVYDMVMSSVAMPANITEVVYDRVQEQYGLDIGKEMYRTETDILLWDAVFYAKIRQCYAMVEPR